MKTTKLFFMAALALMTAACSNDDNDLTTQQPQKAEGITITAQLAPKTSGATTRAVSDGTDKIVAEWAVNEHIAILYTKDATKYAADATITAVDGSGTATITFTVEEAGGVGLGIAVFPTVMLTILVTATVLSDSVWLCKHRNVWPLPLVCLNKLYLC